MLCFSTLVFLSESRLWNNNQESKFKFIVIHSSDYVAALNSGHTLPKQKVALEEGMKTDEKNTYT